jgi:hypothetical protein
VQSSRVKYVSSHVIISNSFFSTYIQFSVPTNYKIAFFSRVNRHFGP